MLHGLAGLATLLFFQDRPVSPPGPCASDTTAIATFVASARARLSPGEKTSRGAFVLVCGGHVAYSSGYGKTAAGEAVDPARTIFRAASNSKLIVATAVLQLAERGMWSLTEDVNRYLPANARLNNRKFGPITLQDLLTHTAGFEDKFAGSVTVPADSISLAQFFTRPPLRVGRPGEEVSYSNVGIALAGYLVEIRSRQSFAHYAAEQIFTPLGMTRSSFSQPPPAEWSRDLASGRATGAQNIFFNPYPAGSLVSTPLDMGRFIAAQLNDGGLDSAANARRILSPASTDLMHASHWRVQPPVPGVAYGFFEGQLNGHRTLFHTGDSGDHSLVFLLPDEHAGIYLVYSGTDDQSIVREGFVQQFMDRFYPAVTETTAQPADSATDPARLAGVYRGAAYSRSNFEKLKALFNQVVVRAGVRGGVALTPPGAPAAIQLRPAGDLVFRGDSGETVAFRTNVNGRVTGLTVSGSVWDPASWDRIGPLEDGRFHLGLFVTVALISVLRLLVWPMAGLVTRVRGRARPRLDVAARSAWRWSAIAAGLVCLAPVAALATAFLSFSPPLRALPRAVIVLEILLALATLSGLALIPLSIRVWRERSLSTGRRIHLTMLAFAFTVLAPLLWYWRLLPIWL